MSSVITHQAATSSQGVAQRLIVVMGRWGSGKTTLIERIATHLINQGIAVDHLIAILNELGEASFQGNQDAKRIPIATEFIDQGCVGCAKTEAFQRMLQRVKQPIIFLEPTGAANGQEIRELVNQLGMDSLIIGQVNVANFTTDRVEGLENILQEADVFCLINGQDPQRDQVIDYISYINGQRLAKGQPEAVSYDLPSDPSPELIQAILDHSSSQTNHHEHGHRCSCGHHHEHGHHHDHAHGSHVLTVGLPNDVTVADIKQLVTILDNQGVNIQRCKGILQGHIFHRLPNGQVELGQKVEGQSEILLATSQSASQALQQAVGQIQARQAERPHRSQVLPIFQHKATRLQALTAYSSQELTTDRLHRTASGSFFEDLMDRYSDLLTLPELIEGMSTYLDWAVRSLQQNKLAPLTNYQRAIDQFILVKAACWMQAFRLEWVDQSHQQLLRQLNPLGLLANSLGQLDDQLNLDFANRSDVFGWPVNQKAIRIWQAYSPHADEITKQDFRVAVDHTVSLLHSLAKGDQDQASLALWRQFQSQLTS